MNKELLVNNNATVFYNKWKKDTVSSLFLSAPLFLILFILLPLFINGPSLGLFFFFIIPLTWIGVGFIYTPFFKRRNPMNFLVKEISLSNDNVISIETFRWFSYKPIYATFDKVEIEINKSLEVPMLKGKEVLVISRGEGKNVEYFYIVQEFFDDFGGLVKTISN